MGIIYDYSVMGTVIFCVVCQLAAIPVLLVVQRLYATLKEKKA